MILARDLVVRFGERTALVLDRLEVEPGGAVGVHGPNGSGKSTLLKVLAGLVVPSSGQVEVPRPGRTTLLHQHPFLFRGTALWNVEVALRPLRIPRRERARLAAEALERVGGSPLADRTAADLSGGERRRVAVARALVGRPELILLDEPLEGLDEAGRRLVLEAVRSSGATRVTASPDPVPDLAADWVALAPPSGLRKSGERP